jgi:hypothetical protein
MPCRVLVRVVLVLFASSLAAAAGCGDGSTGPTAPLTEKQKEKEGKRPPVGGPAGPKSK